MGAHQLNRRSYRPDEPRSRVSRRTYPRQPAGYSHRGTDDIARARSERERLNLAAPKFSLPPRDYYLFNGPVEAATRIGVWVTADWFDPQSPSIFWPADHAWCVATEIDFDSTLVAGTPELIAAITSSTELEALSIAPDAFSEDLINT